MYGFESFCILFVWSSIHSIGNFFFTGRKCVDLVVIFNKREKNLRYPYKIAKAVFA